MSLLPAPATDTVVPATQKLPRHEDSAAAARVRFLANCGRLADEARASAERRWLRRGVYEIIWPVAYDGLTRGLERRRGHRTCALGVEYLEPDCLDRFEDDVEAVLDDLLRQADVPIRNLEGWVRSRLVKATVDGNRRRRGERGALQRPRIPQWLGYLLAGDRWLRTLALDIMVWVGVQATAGVGLWPYAAWADRRAAITGDYRTTERDVERDVEKVLAMMRQNLSWYDRYIERPLGRKQAPPLPADGVMDTARGWPHLALAERHEADEAMLIELAALAIDAIAARVARGEDHRTVVVEVLRTTFGAGVAHMDWAPGTESADDEQVLALIGDREAIDRLVSQVDEILSTP